MVNGPSIWDSSCLLESVVYGGGGSGLFLLANPLRCYPDYLLWNPATREIKLIPGPPSSVPSSSHLEPPFRPWHFSECWGVGLDLVAHDIKVVVIRSYVHVSVGEQLPILSLPVSVYSLRSNCWKELLVSYPRQGSTDGHRLYCPTYFKGFFHWIFRSCNEECVLAFDMGSDSFHKIDYPCDAPGWHCNLSIYRESIALFVQHMNVLSVDVWLLSSSSSDGQYWCWIKHSILGPFSDGLLLKGFWNDDQLIAQRPHDEAESQLVLFDIGSKNVEVLVHNCFLLRDWYIYKDALVCINGEIQV